MTACLSKRGLVAQSRLDKGLFQGWTTTLDSLMNVRISLYCVRKAKRAGYLFKNEAATTAGLIDDAVQAVEMTPGSTLEHAQKAADEHFNITKEVWKNLAAERYEEPEELTRGICGSRMKLAAACRKVSHRATVARRRRNAFKNERTQDGCQRRLAAARRGTSHHAEVARKMQADKKMPRRATVARRVRDIFRHNMTCRATVARFRKDIFRPNTTPKEITIRKHRTRDNMVRGTLKRRTSGRGRQPQRKCNEGIRNQDVEELLHNRGLRRNSTFLRYQRPPEKQTMDWTRGWCRPPPKRKNKHDPCWRNQ
jgi:hypothetical protein